MDFNKARFNMVEQQIRPWNVLDFDVLDALDEIPREEFVLEAQRGYAYSDLALTLENGGYMLEPKIVARMVQGLQLKKTDRVLEVGTGSGYATALLAKLSADVLTYDIDSKQQQFAKNVLNRLEYANIRYEIGDGLVGVDNQAKFDAIYVGGGLPAVPEALKQQLAEGGRLVVVVGGAPVQRCMQIVRTGDVFSETVLFDTLVSGLNAKAVPAKSKFTF